MLVVRVELGPCLRIDTVEIGEEVGRVIGFVALAGAFQILDQRLGMDLLLNVERRRLDHEVRPVRHILSPPHQLRIEIAIAPLVGDLDRPLGLGIDEGFQLRRGRVLAGRLVMGERFDAEGFFG
ncbi:hypothetical protein [Novosphingobium marinum]|uniref:Uncharacterized protein n=1 Tax=Novosphingobium marinum TaxID=1514948 RepID=A0A7Z0BVA6_9SPHN|nr:hypothetical protein [Novosphingobium marinum]NYH97084.1 hypothetical protein [Novosphingobium marinum]